MKPIIQNHLVSIPNSNISIQTRTFISSDNRNMKFDNLGVIISHPHPLYGGTMQNNVVRGIRDILLENGIFSATYNFRGVGKSTGSYDNGIGEQQDLIEVANFIYKTYPKKRKIILVGYSFGALITLAASCKIENIIGISLISYPFNFIKEIEPNYEFKKPILFINGDKDEVAKLNILEKEIKNFSNQNEVFVIPGADHFYINYENKVGQKIFEFINKIL